VVIQTPDQRLRVFVSSTLGELADERRAVARAISALRLTPVMFELGARPHPPQDVYRAYLDQSDVFIGLYWQRYGFVADGMTVSGLEDEFELAAGLPRLMYVKVPAPDREPRLADLLSRVAQHSSYRSFRRPAELARLVRDDLATLLSERFAAPRADPGPPPRPRSLPVATTSLVGRDQTVADVVALVADPAARLVTLTGPSGVGKTRLALAVAGHEGDQLPADRLFVSLAAVSRPDLALTKIGHALQAQVGTASPLDALVEQIGDGRWLLILDNVEQVVDVATDLDELLHRCPGVTVLATSLRVLQLRAEREFPVSPLPFPSDAGSRLDELWASPAVELFVDRAQAVRPDFALTTANAASVAEICRLLAGLPLAIELAAARTRILDPELLLARLSMSLDALGTAPVDAPDRQHTLRATVDWSIGLLDPAERSLLESMAVFVDGWPMPAAAEVAAVREDRALDLTEALIRHSLVVAEATEAGSRCRMLSPIRAFVAERLAARMDTVDIGRRHAEWFWRLATQADAPLRGVHQNVWADRLQVESANIAAAVRWYLDHDKRPLPHLFRVLSLFWILRDHLAEARTWVDQMLPIADSLDPLVRVELLCSAAIVITDVGDDTAAPAAHQRLAPAWEAIKDTDPFLYALSGFTLAGLSAIEGDVDHAVETARAAMDQLREMDEPFWTALGMLQVGFLEIIVGRLDDARDHLLEVRQRAAQFDSTWLSAWTGAALGNLAIMQGRPDEAAELLDESLRWSVAAHTPRTITLCVAAYSRLALALGEPERAALLAGAADGLRQRAGLRPWPRLRQGDLELMGTIRRALDAGRFDEAFATGTGLRQHEAVSAIQRWRGIAMDA
jgi:predicted ATPase